MTKLGEAGSLRPWRRRATICTPAGNTGVRSPSNLPNSSELRTAISRSSAPLPVGAWIFGFRTMKAM